jgi:3-hydroxyacyl-CoA dehydrogenase
MNVDDVKKVGVFGAWTMDSGIVQVVGSNGKDTVHLDVSDFALDREMKII